MAVQRRPVSMFNLSARSGFVFFINSQFNNTPRSVVTIVYVHASVEGGDPHEWTSFYVSRSEAWFSNDSVSVSRDFTLFNLLSSIS